MASTPQVYKTLGQNDKVGSKTLLHEQIPITGTITGNKLNTYGTFPSESNIKYFNAGTHIDVYDYPYASSSANFMFSITAGYSANSPSGPQPITDKALKNNIYRQFAQQYVGYDTNQDFVEFNVSGVLNPPNTYPPRYDGCVFFDFSRVLMKDEIKKGSFTIEIGTGSFSYPFAEANGTTAIKTFSDAHVNANDASTYKTNSPMGDYALLQLGTTTTVPENSEFGFLFYEAGLLVLSASVDVFGQEFASGSVSTNKDSSGTGEAQVARETLSSGSIGDVANAARHHLNNIQFNNTTELNSTIYFCRANNNEFNYSSNPSFTSGGQITVKNNPDDPSVTYVTSVGLYSADNQLLAVGKLSEPIKKTSSTEFTLRVRLDY